MANIYELFSLKGKKALITGGAGHVGYAISQTLAELGADVYIASRDKAKCQEAASKIAGDCQHRIVAKGLHLDVLNAESIRSCFSEIEKDCGGLDVLANAAWSGKKNTFETINDADWDFDIEMCLSSVFRCVKAAHPGLKRKKGLILNVASMYGHVSPDYRMYEGTPYANPPSYGAAKAGVIQFTRYLASFLSPDGIRANCISPGPFPFGATCENKVFMDRLKSKNPLQRIGQPEDLKGAVALLCSGASGYMTGQNLCVDGGWAIW